MKITLIYILNNKKIKNISNNFLDLTHFIY